MVWVGMIPFLMTPFLREIIGLMAVILTFVALVPYVYWTAKGQIKPHMFSWIIWGITTLIVFFAQTAEGAGEGSWSIGISAILTLIVAVLAYLKNADRIITKIDWLFFGLAVGALPIWYVTSNPLGAVVILTIVDVLGFLPTARYVYQNPYADRLILYVVIVLRNILSIVALENCSLVNALFPAVMSVACGGFAIMVAIKRFRLERIKKIPPV